MTREATLGVASVASICARPAILYVSDARGVRGVVRVPWGLAETTNGLRRLFTKLHSVANDSKMCSSLVGRVSNDSVALVFESGPQASCLYNVTQRDSSGVIVGLVSSANAEDMALVFRLFHGQLPPLTSALMNVSYTAQYNYNGSHDVLLHEPIFHTVF